MTVCLCQAGDDQPVDVFPVPSDRLPSSATWRARAHLSELAACAVRFRDEMSAHDVAAHVEEILDLLGWDRFDLGSMKRGVREGGEVARVELRIAERARVAILVRAPNAFLSAHDALQWRRREAAEDVVLTDGAQWMILRPETKQPAFQQIGVDDPLALSGLVRSLQRPYQLRRLLLGGTAGDEKGHVLDAELGEFLHDPSVAQAMAERLAKAGLRLAPGDVAASVQLRLEARSNLTEPPAAARQGQQESEIAQLDGAKSLPREAQYPFWPEGATHKLGGRGYASFIRFDPETERATILPGSVMRARTGRSFPQYHRRLRDDAIAVGLIRAEGDRLQVVAELTLETLTTAATFVSGVVNSGWRAWRDPDGNRISRDSLSKSQHDAAKKG
jgi:hypothetical protein